VWKRHYIYPNKEAQAHASLKLDFHVAPQRKSHKKCEINDIKNNLFVNVKMKLEINLFCGSMESIGIVG